MKVTRANDTVFDWKCTVLPADDQPIGFEVERIARGLCDLSCTDCVQVGALGPRQKSRCELIM